MRGRKGPTPRPNRPELKKLEGDARLCNVLLEVWKYHVHLGDSAALTNY